jgi:outer membrane protein assembly factor BamD (BamD/ComL family)
VRAAPTAAVAVPAASESEEATMMAKLREMRQADPELSLRLARAGNRQFPASPDAAERAEIVVKSLMRMGCADEAIAEAKTMVAKYPGTVWAADVQHHMLDVPSYVPDAAVP